MDHRTGQQYLARIRETVETYSQEPSCFPVHSLMEGSDEQNRASNEVLKAISDMSTRLDEALAAITSTDNLLDGTASAASTGYESVTKIAEGMDLIQNTFSGVASTVRQLGKRSEKIGGMVQAIQALLSRSTY